MDGRRMRRRSETYLVPEIPAFRSRSNSSPAALRPAAKGKTFSTPLLSSMFAALARTSSSHEVDGLLSDGQRSDLSTDRASSNCDNSYLMPSARHHATASKGGPKRLEITVKNHPTLPGVIVSELGPFGAAAAAGLHVGDHIVSIDGHVARNHRVAIEIADSAEKRVTFAVADRTRVVRINRRGGNADVGITCVNNTVAGLGVVVVGLKGSNTAMLAGIEVGDVINSIDGQLALEHSEVIAHMDAATGILELVLASKKLTEASVLNQWAEHVPCQIVVAE